MDSRLAAKFHVRPPTRTTENRLLNRLRPVMPLYQFVRAERSARTGLPLRQRIRSWRYGFYTQSYLLYDLERNDPRDYLPDTCYNDFSVNDPHLRTLSNKLSFSRLMELYGVPHPRVLALINRGRTHVFDEQVPAAVDFPSLIRKLLDAWAARPEAGRYGHGTRHPLRRRNRGDWHRRQWRTGRS